MAGTNLVFPAPRGGQLSDMTLTAVLRRMKLDVVPHGFRSTFREWAGESSGHPRLRIGQGKLVQCCEFGNQIQLCLHISKTRCRMKVYVFTSENMTNVWAGVGAQLWAVPRSLNETSNKGRATKASKMPVGAFGLLYCSSAKCFTSPFVVNSLVDRQRTVENVWPEVCILPFAIRTLGNPHASLSWKEAADLLPSCQNGTPLSKLIHVEPLTVFTGDEITESDWSLIVGKLAN